MRHSVPLLLVAGLMACTAAQTVAPGAAAPHSEAPLPFISDDYPRALAQARQSGLPLFVDTWAPW